MEKITLRVFWMCMLACASFAVTGIWLHDRVPEALFKATATFFVAGLASFLLWAPLVVYRFLSALSSQR